MSNKESAAVREAAFNAARATGLPLSVSRALSRRFEKLVEEAKRAELRRPWIRLLHDKPSRTITLTASDNWTGSATEVFASYLSSHKLIGFKLSRESRVDGVRTWVAKTSRPDSSPSSPKKFVVPTKPPTDEELFAQLTPEKQAEFIASLLSRAREASS